MINILKERIIDDRFIRLIRKFSKAGYWTYHNTHTVALRRVVLLVLFWLIFILTKRINTCRNIKDNSTEGKNEKRNPEYRKFEVQRRNVVSKLKTVKDENQRNELVKKLREIEKERNDVPYGIAQDENYRRIVYQRYADDFLIGVIGSESDNQAVKEDIKQFLLDNLKLELSGEKTLVTRAKKPAKFLGYNIYVRESSLPKRDKAGRLARNYGGRIVLAVTMETIRKKLLDYNVVKMVHHNGNEVWKPKDRYNMKDNDDLEILEQYNAEIRGFYNYYSIANNSSMLNSFYYIMEYITSVPLKLGRY